MSTMVTFENHCFK